MALSAKGLTLEKEIEMGVWVGALLANKKSSENNTCMNNTCMENALDRYEAWLEKEVNRPCESVEKIL